MSNPIVRLIERVESLPKAAQEAVDQTLHLLAGAAIGGLFGGLALIWLPSLIAGWIAVMAGAASAAIRETVQNLGDETNDVLDAVVDATVWTVGGVVSAALIWWLA